MLYQSFAKLGGGSFLICCYYDPKDFNISSAFHAELIGQISDMPLPKPISQVQFYETIKISRKMENRFFKRIF